MLKKLASNEIRASKTDPDATLVRRKDTKPFLTHRVHISVDGGESQIVKELLESQLRELEMSRSLALTKDRILAYLRANQQILVDRTDEQACRQLVEAYVEKVTVYRDRVEVTLKFGSDLYKTGGGGGSRTHVRRGSLSGFYECSVGFGLRWKGALTPAPLTAISMVLAHPSEN